MPRRKEYTSEFSLGIDGTELALNCQHDDGWEPWRTAGDGTLWFSREVPTVFGEDKYYVCEEELAAHEIHAALKGTSELSPWRTDKFGRRWFKRHTDKNIIQAIPPEPGSMGQDEIYEDYDQDVHLESDDDESEVSAEDDESQIDAGYVPRGGYKNDGLDAGGRAHPDVEFFRADDDAEIEAELDDADLDDVDDDGSEFDADDAGDYTDEDLID